MLVHEVDTTLWQMAEYGHDCSTHHTYKIGCIIKTKDGSSYMGANHAKTHPRSPHPFKSVHAEFSALLNAAKHSCLDKSNVWVSRFDKRGKLANAKPCQFCEEILRKVGVARVWYSTESGSKMLNFNEPVVLECPPTSATTGNYSQPISVR